MEILRLTTGVIGVAAFTIVGMLVRRFWTKHRASNWSQCTAVVEESEITDNGWRGPKIYYVKVLYKYELMRIHAVGCVLPSEFGIGDKSEAEALLECYHQGASILVYVNPKDEACSMLLRDISWMEWLALFFFTVIGVIFAYLSFVRNLS
jgi:hypothetical protein